jgi:predicted lipase
MINLGSPRVGNPAFAQFFDSRIPAGRRYRMVNNMDVVPSVPLLLNGFA